LKLLTEVMLLGDFSWLGQRCYFLFVGIVLVATIHRFVLPAAFSHNRLKKKMKSHFADQGSS